LNIDEVVQFFSVSLRGAKRRGNLVFLKYLETWRLLRFARNDLLQAFLRDHQYCTTQTILLSPCSERQTPRQIPASGGFLCFIMLICAKLTADAYRKNTHAPDDDAHSAAITETHPASRTGRAFTLSLHTDLP